MVEPRSYVHEYHVEPRADPSHKQRCVATRTVRHAPSGRLLTEDGAWAGDALSGEGALPVSLSSTSGRSSLALVAAAHRRKRLARRARLLLS